MRRGFAWVTSTRFSPACFSASLSLRRTVLSITFCMLSLCGMGQSSGASIHVFHASGSSRAIRGGTVWAQAKFCHCALRASMAPDVNDGSNSPTLGYRFFLTIP